jgi:hypothetical protein
MPRGLIVYRDMISASKRKAERPQQLELDEEDSE